MSLLAPEEDEKQQPHVQSGLDQIEAYANDPANHTPRPSGRVVTGTSQDANGNQYTSSTDQTGNKYHEGSGFKSVQAADHAAERRDAESRINHDLSLNEKQRQAAIDAAQKDYEAKTVAASDAAKGFMGYGEPEGDTDQAKKNADSTTNNADDAKNNNGSRPGMMQRARAALGDAEKAARAKEKGEKVAKAGEKVAKIAHNPAVSIAARLVLGKRKKKVLYGSLSGVAILLSIIGFFFTIPFKLINVANVLSGNFKISDHISKQTEIKLLQRMFGAHLHRDGGRRAASGRLLKDGFTNVRIEKFRNALAKDGISMVFDEKNRFIGLSKDGKLYGEDLRGKSFWERRSAVGNLVHERIAPYRFLKTSLYTKAMRLHAGVSFKFWALEKAGDLKEKLVSKVRKGIAGDAALAEKESGGKEKAPPDGDGKGSYDADKAATEEAARQASEAAKAQTDVFNKTNDLVLAHKAGIASFRTAALKSVGWTGIGIFYCLIKEMIDTVNEAAGKDLTVALIREGNMVLTQGNQTIPGAGTLAEIGQMLLRYDGDPQADPAKDEDAKDFTKAAAWRRQTGEPVVTAHDNDHYAQYTPDLSEAANPDGKALQGIIGSISEIFQIPGSAGVCSVLNSWFGWVLQGVEIAVAIFDGEASTFAAQAVKGALVIFALQTIIPKILDAATHLAVTGTENAVGLVNNADAGLALSAADFGRVMGDRAATVEELAPLFLAADADKTAEAQQKGWTYRTFALNNSDSLLARLIMKTPNSPAGALASISDAITSIPRNFATILSPNLVHAEGTLNPYGFRPYLTTDAEIDNIDPVGAEDFLYEKVGETGQTRLEMLGDPTKYTPADGPWTATNDLMHCFVGSFRSPNEKDDICLDLGVLTQSGKATPENPGPDQILKKIYCDEHDVCNLGWTHQINKYCPDDNSDDGFSVCGTTTANDFDIYRAYLKDSFLWRGLEGETTDTDPFAATGQPNGGAPSTSTAVGNPKDLAKQILADGNITKSGRLVTEDLKDAEAGEDASAGTPLSAHMLQVLVNLAQTYKFTITAIESGGTGHASTSNHYDGTAVDVYPNNGDFNAMYKTLYDNRVAWGLDELIFNPAPAGTSTLKNGKAFHYDAETLNGHKTHIHYSTEE